MDKREQIAWEVDQLKTWLGADVFEKRQAAGRFIDLTPTYERPPSEFTDLEIATAAVNADRETGLVLHQTDRQSYNATRDALAEGLREGVIAPTLSIMQFAFLK